MKNELSRMLSTVLVVLLVFSTEVLAAPGDLDPTFTGSGFVALNVGLAGPVANATTTQPDGKVIAVGTTFVSTPSGNDALIVRFNSDGSLDTSFDTDGIVFVAPGGNEIFQAVALQPDGKIVAVGQCQIGSVRFMIVRFNSDGSLDSTFDTDGIVTTNMTAGSFDQAVALAIQPDGKIVVLGSSKIGLNTDFAIARYNSNGSFDTSFSDDGNVVLNISTSTENGADDRPLSVALQLDGKIVGAGWGNTARNPIVFRLNSNGTLDTNFDNDGIIIGPAGTIATSVAIQWDGKIVVAGDTLFPFDFIVTRYNSDGTRDVSFDGDGIVTTNIPPAGVSDDFTRAMTLQSDGKIIVAGYTSNTNANFATVRYNSDGSLDNSWGNGGRVTTTFDPFGSGQLFGVTSAADGKVVASGKIHNIFGVVRYQGAPIAASAKISGRVVNSKGQGVAKARVVLTNMQTGTTKIILTNPFGYYNFPDLPTMANYTVSVASKRHQFYQNTQSLQLFMDVLGLHFIGN